jgi:hypothetical protein
MTEPSQPQDGSLQEFMVLAHSLREASARRDYVALASLLVEYLDPSAIDMVVYVRRQDAGHLVLLGAYIQLTPASPGMLNREPTLEEMAVVLQAARR